MIQIATVNGLPNQFVCELFVCAVEGACVDGLDVVLVGNDGSISAYEEMGAIDDVTYCSVETLCLQCMHIN